MRFIKINNQGFTLVEMLIVTVMMAVISLAIYSTFNNGMKIWQRMEGSYVEEDVNLFFERFAFDLRNTFKFSLINFSGEKDKIEFATIVNSPRLDKNTVGKVIYFYDPNTGSLSKEQLDFASIYKDEASRQVLNGIRSFKFSYYFYDADKKEYAWEENSLGGKLPLAVRVELEVGLNSEDLQKFTKTVSIPLSE